MVTTRSPSPTPTRRSAPAQRADSRAAPANVSDPAPTSSNQTRSGTAAAASSSRAGADFMSISPRPPSAQHRRGELAADSTDQLIGPLLQVAGRAFGRPLGEHGEVAEREPGGGQPGAEPGLDVGGEPAEVGAEPGFEHIRVGLGEPEQGP